MTTPLAAARLAALLTASRAVVEENRHTEGCTRHEHFAAWAHDMARLRGRASRDALYAETLRTAPPCDCVFGLLAVAVAAFNE